MTQFSEHAKTATVAFIKRACVGVALAGALLANAKAALADAHDTPVGTWQTIDDHTGKPKALVEISQNENGELVGKVIKGLSPNDTPGRRCTECIDERKDQPILGMTIIRNMKRDGDVWDGGYILDPENGKEYRCKMSLDEGGRKLKVRGYLGVPMLGRTQTWLRQE
jgi:uncharacterized protein (DUF2147 family)